MSYYIIFDTISNKPFAPHYANPRKAQRAIEYHKKIFPPRFCEGLEVREVVTVPKTKKEA